MVDKKRETKLLVTKDLSKIFWSIKINWSSLAAGSLMAITVQLLLSSVSSLFGLDVKGVANILELQNVFGDFSLWIIFCSVISAFSGSYISSRISGNRFAVDGFVTGVFVWAIYVLTGVILSYLGASGLIGYGTNAVDMLRGIVPSGMAVSVDEIRVAADIAVVQTRYFLIGALLSLITAIFGGWLASEKRLISDRKAATK